MTPGELTNLAGLAAALAAADQHGLLEILIAGGSSDELAARRGLDPRATRLVLDVLVAAGAAARDGEGRYQLSPSLAPFAGSDLFGAAGTMWSMVPRFLSSGEALPPMDSDPSSRGQAYRQVVDRLGQLFGRVAADLARVLPSGRRRILDVGAGSGVWGLAQLEREPDARLTAIDLPEVLPRVEARAAALGLAARVTLLPGNFHQVPLPDGGFDRVVVANVLRLEPPDRARSLLARLARAVAAGGELVVVDAFSDGSPARALTLSVYALHLGLRTASARPHSVEDLRVWLEEAGLRPSPPFALGDDGMPVGALLAAA